LLGKDAGNALWRQDKKKTKKKNEGKIDEAVTLVEAKDTKEVPAKSQ